jgi:DNA polymerase-3 subunit alpha
MYLKTYYPVEFYAASLTYVDDKKVRSIITEANKAGINVDPPSINHSTDKFVPASGSRIVAPLSKIKYVQAAATVIMDERNAGGPFTSVENLQDRVPKRLCNSRVVGALKAVGAMDEIDPESAAMDPVERSKAINDYLPSLPLGFVQIDRKIDLERAGKNSLGTLLLKLKEEDPSFVMPLLGKTPKFMVVLDCPSASEAKAGKLTESKAFTSIARALYRADLNKADGYWTSLVKRPKRAKEKLFDNATLEGGFKILKQEIEILKPPAIICLGSNINRMFVPDLKGSATDNAGQVHYSSELDCNIILGFSPGMLFHNRELEEPLNELFETLASLV